MVRFVEQRVAIAEEAVRQAVATLDPDALAPSEAGRLLAALDQVARVAAAGSTLLARRVADGDEWREAGYASAAELLAARSGISLGAARRKVKTSKALADLDRTRCHMAEGRLSTDQADTIADAAAANPAAEGDLLDLAGRANLHELRDAALRAKAAADPDDAERDRRQRKARRVTRYTDAEGARHLNIRGPIADVAAFEAELDRRLSARIRQRPSGEALESRDAMAFDAAMDMAQRSQRADNPSPDAEGTAGNGDAVAARGTSAAPGSSAAGHPADAGRGGSAEDGAPARAGAGGRRGQPAPQHLALLRLDVAALWRGYVQGDELCEVAGLGPIPVEAARRLLGHAVVKLIITKGQAVAHVTSLTRGPTQAMRYALLWSSPTCTVEGCTRTIVEHDHRYGAEYKDTRHTRLDELDRLCNPHHDLHTHHRWALVPGTGKRPMVPPDDPRHPANAATAAARAGPADRSPTPASSLASGTAARAGPSGRPDSSDGAAPADPSGAPEAPPAPAISGVRTPPINVSDPAVQAQLRSDLDRAISRRSLAMRDDARIQRPA